MVNENAARKYYQAHESVNKEADAFYALAENVKNAAEEELSAQKPYSPAGNPAWKGKQASAANDARIEAAPAKRRNWPNISNAGTFIIGAGASAALSMSIRASVMGIGAFAGFGGATIGGVTILPVAAAMAAGAGVGFYKYARERHQQINSGVEVTASLKKHLLASTFLGFAGGAASQAFMHYILPLPFTQQALDWAGSKLAAAVTAIPGGDMVKDAAKSAAQKIGAYAAPIVVKIVETANELFDYAKTSVAPLAAPVKSMFASAFSTVKGFFGFKSPDIKTDTIVIKPDVQQTVSADASGESAKGPEIKTPELNIESQLPSTEEMQKTVEDSIKPIQQANHDAGLAEKSTESMQQDKLEHSFKSLEERDEFKAAFNDAQNRAKEIHDSVQSNQQVTAVEGHKPETAIPADTQATDVVPVAAAPVFTDHTIKKGESLWKIAKNTYGLKTSDDIADAVKQLRNVNGMSVSQGNRLSIGQVIKLPENLDTPKVVAPQADAAVTMKDVPLPVARPDFESAAAAKDTVIELKKVPTPTPRPVFPEDTGAKAGTEKTVTTSKQPVVKLQPVVKGDAAALPEKGPLPKARPATELKGTAARTRDIAPKAMTKGDLNCIATAVFSDGQGYSKWTCKGGGIGKFPNGFELNSFPVQLVK